MAVEINATAPKSSIASKLRTVHVGLREDLEVTRHVFRGEPSYAIRDPMTFQSQQLTPADYDIVISISAGKPLSAVFDSLVRRGKVTADDEENFYQFVFSLHGLGFLRLPMADDKFLYKRFLAKRAAKRKQKLMGFLFLQVPLVRPNAFLDRTMHLVRPLFSRTAFVLWLILMITAIYVGFSHHAELAKPLDGLLAAKNLPLMWLTLIVLKLFHELGHAYACKHYGGHVPEMGAYFILFTPCAYVDATACWGFTRKWERLVVCLGGMYVESIFAAVAVFVWSATEPSLLHALAYNVIFIAGTITVIFNANPLMRYDGYHILSDLTEVPNLRARAAQYITYLLKRRCLGVPVQPPPGNRRLKILLFSFGIAATIYRSVIIFGIAAVIATKFFVLGLSMAAFYVANTAIGIIRRLINYLWHSPETAAIRWRSIGASLAVLLIFPAIALFAPLPASVQATGVIGTDQETVIRAQVPGFVSQVAVEPGATVEAGAQLIDLVSEVTVAAAAQAEATLYAARIRENALRGRDPAGMMAEHDRVEAAELAVNHANDELMKMHLQSPVNGLIASGIRLDDVGRYVREGTPLAMIISGDWQARTILTQEQMASSKPRVGQVVEFRAASNASRTLRGTITRIAPAGSRKIALSALTYQGGGEIVTDAATHEASQPFFEILIAIPPDGAEHLRYGMTGVARLPATAEPIATRVKRRLDRFIDKLVQQ